ncbi:UDP-N-acetylmuramoyl-tripeptide--D-alanyl-D-alanine ligase [Lewinella sp. W8]|uniref:UDP-N-acetylmuramoyl-tripeptide--D-alanyl-D- alanine ligase n=1 Tax=Lewinella sp. W8 TaxID=2528208 RepID=UPI001067C868|nr:UDP-N-acetylmuramoyl-tripeptide--D-alanyl-D-alanine ligase [Lewinella sp. W8]MTB53150.1 UDP-N-acetylmuramoyl-tripeptide--D-alanyl-D-alanine ligase [Lewinella sp. W8]
MEPAFATEEVLYDAYLANPRVCIDSRKIQAGDLFVALVGSRVDGNQFARTALEAGAAKVIVDDPGVVIPGDDRFLYVDDSLNALQTIARRHRINHRMPVLAITGSNGKTTTKELIRDVMSRQYRVHATPGNYNNHLGLPLTILSAPADTEMMILEMGANAQREIAALCSIGLPTHGLVTNVGDAHLEGFGGREGVIKGKGELYDYLADNKGVAFVNADEEHLANMARNVGRIIPYQVSEAPSPTVAAMEIKVFALQPQLEVGFLDEYGTLIRCRVALNGRHNLQNVKAAIGVGKYFKVPGIEIAAALSAYRSQNQRSQELEHRGVSFYWDAYNANPTSMEASLTAFGASHSPTEAVIVLGEMLELGEVAPAAHRRIVLRAGQLAEQVILVGAEMKAAAREFNRPWFEDSGQLSAWFWEQDWSGKTVFVKGSRGNKLERLLAGSSDIG